MALVSKDAQTALDHARRGDLGRAVLLAEAAIAKNEADPGLRMFAGTLHARLLNLPAAAVHLARAHALMPADPLPAIELSRVLVGLGELESAHDVLRTLPASPAIAAEAAKIEALMLRQQGLHDQAAALLQRVVSQNMADFEAWDQLGAVHLAAGRPAEAVSALTRALRLRPELAALRSRLVDAHHAAGDADTALQRAYEQAAADPRDPLGHVDIARFEDLAGRPERAEKALQRAIEIDPNYTAAQIMLGDLLERSNQIDALGRLIDGLRARNVPVALYALLWARYLLRRGQFEEALGIARSAPMAMEGSRRMQLIGQILDRLAEPSDAFAAFAEMNRLVAAEAADCEYRASRYREAVAARLSVARKSWFDTWNKARPSADRPAPTFLFGFPRSGTTLLDTLLAGHDQTVVLEEQPAIEAVGAQLGRVDQIGMLDASILSDARRRYFDAVDALAPDAFGRHIIDKNPLGAINAAAIHRLFPDARYVFIERHPCDVVLSCFMTRFKPVDAGASFTALETSARLYVEVLELWHRYKALLPLSVHTLRYEDLIDDPERQMRSLLRFLDLEWQPDMLDQSKTALRRSHIASPSYAQVAEPIYRRASGRWLTYRDQLAPVMPILEPWIERLGYASVSSRLPQQTSRRGR